MSNGIRPLLLLGLAAVPLCSGPLDAQVGLPLEALELSNTAGGLEGQLEPASSFGSAIANVGDLDGDGIPDLFVGASTDAGSGSQSGALFALFLNADGSVRSSRRTDASSGTLCISLSNFDELGSALEPLGDLSGDGTFEVAVGLAGWDGNDLNEGAILILSLAADGTASNCVPIGEGMGGFGGALSQGDGFGTSLANVGDLDGDGIPELAVGMPRDNSVVLDAGSVWILFLRADGTVRTEEKLTEGIGGFTGDLDPMDQFGAAVTSPGDLDGDGLGDLLVGATEDDDGGLDSGAVWAILLGANGLARSELKISTGQSGLEGPLVAGEHFGGGLHALPDLDGNGVRDVLVGSIEDDAGMFGDAGAYWLLLLGPNGVVLAEEKVRGGEMPFPYVVDFDQGLGVAMCFVGDVDGDGAPTVAFGVPGLLAAPDGAVWMTEICDADPLPAFSARGATTGTSPLVVDFQDESTGSGLSTWLWDFGDGRASTQASPTHAFTKVGTYDVTLTVTGADGTCALTQEALVVVDSAFAQASTRNGSGTNPDVLQSLSLPVLGTTWAARVDATSIGANGLVFLVGYEFGFVGFPTPFGELLLDVTSLQLALDIQVLIGGISDHAIPVPGDLALSGCSVALQALLNGSGQLTNAVDLVLGL